MKVDLEGPLPMSAADSASENEDEADDTEVQEVKPVVMSRSRARGSVCAESTVVDREWRPPKIHKTPEQAEQIRNALANNFMFNVLAPDKLLEVIGAFRGPQILQPGERVIRQGDMVESGEPGLFILERGTLDVYLSRNSCEDSLGQRNVENTLRKNICNVF